MYALELLRRLVPALRESARLLIIRDGRILLVRSIGCTVFQLPGGGVERDEAPDGAALRETLEETGLHVEAPTMVGVFVPDPRRRIRRFLATRELDLLRGQIHLFVSGVATGAVLRQWEIAETVWRAPDRLPETLSPDTRAFIDEGLKKYRQERRVDV